MGPGRSNGVEVTWWATSHKPHPHSLTLLQLGAGSGQFAHVCTLHVPLQRWFAVDALLAGLETGAKARV